MYFYLSPTPTQPPPNPHPTPAQSSPTPVLFSLPKIVYHGLVQSITQALTRLFHPHHANQHRPKVLHPHAYFVYILLIGFFYAAFAITRLSPGVQSILGYSSNITADQVIELTNTSRAKKGLSPLENDQSLSQAALAKASYMLDHQFWAHTAPDGTQPWAFFDQAGYKYSVAGENLARDFADSDQMQAAWLASPTHADNILSPRYTQTGIAVVNGTLLGSQTTLVVQLFARPASVKPTLQGTAATDRRITLQLSESELSVDSKVLASESWPIATLGGTQIATLEDVVFKTFSPLSIMKAAFMGLLCLLLGVLIYDAFLLGHETKLRLVGKNMAHIIFFSCALLIMIIFRSGIVN